MTGKIGVPKSYNHGPHSLRTECSSLLNDEWHLSHDHLVYHSSNYVVAQSASPLIYLHQASLRPAYDHVRDAFQFHDLGTCVS